MLVAYSVLNLAPKLDCRSLVRMDLASLKIYSCRFDIHICDTGTYQYIIYVKH